MTSKLVPVEPTEEMVTDGARRLLRFEDDLSDTAHDPLQWAAARNDAEHVWRSMWLAAAPKEPTGEPDIRGAICKIISKMLDDPDVCGIYKTTRCYDELEAYIAAALAHAKREGMEEAAQIAFQWRDEADAGKHPDVSDPAHSFGQGFAANCIGKRILAAMGKK